MYIFFYSVTMTEGQLLSQEHTHTADTSMDTAKPAFRIPTRLSSVKTTIVLTKTTLGNIGIAVTITESTPRWSILVDTS